MKIKTSALVRRAIMLLDEDMEELDLAQTYGDPGMELRKLASELTEEALTKTFLEADTEIIYECKTLDTSYIVANNDGTADIPLPDDCSGLLKSESTATSAFCTTTATLFP